MYSETQKNLVAYHLARAGMNVAGAVETMREQEETLRRIGENTVRGWLMDEEFSKQVAGYTTALREEQLRAACEAERNAFQRKLSGSRLDRLQQMEDEGWEMFERLKEMFKAATDDKKDAPSLKDLFEFWKQTQAFAMALRAKHGSVLTESWQTEILVQAFVAEITTAYGGGATEQIIKRVNETYCRAVAEHKAKLADAQGESHVAKAPSP